MSIIKVLVVEDDGDDFEMMKRALDECSRIENDLFFVECAPSVEIANQMRRIDQHDLFIIDYHLSGSETGLDLARQIYSLDRHAAIILCSGRDGLVLDPESLAWVSSGQMTFLHKRELSRDSLKKAVDAVLGREVRLLIVEDDAEDYELARLELSLSSTYRYITDCASTLAEATNLLHKPYDAIMIDIRLGAESGLDLVHEIVARGIEVPVVLVTGEADVDLGEEMVRMIGRRRIGFLSKRAMNVDSVTHTLQRVAGSRLH